MYGDIDPDDDTADGEPFDEDTALAEWHAALDEVAILRQQEAAAAATANGPDLLITGDDFPF